MKLLILCALVAMALSQPMDSLDGQYQWQLFKVEHMKEYRSEKEEQHRKDIFLSNLQYVREHNERYNKGEVTFEVEINQFADMTTKEITDTRTGFKMPASYNSAGEQFILEDCLELPEAVDWRKEGAVTPVKNQLSCGSCWAFSATGTLEGQWFLKTKKLVPMSEQNLVDCSGEQYGTNGCDGANSLHGAFDFIMDNKGINTEESYPYEGQENECRYNPNTIGAQVTGYVHIKQGSEEELQKATATVGPISVAIDANHTSFDTYKQGIYKEPECSTDELNHAVLVVGYGTTSNGEDYWLVKNSWGTNWGMNGYMLFARNNNNMCGIANIPIYPKV